MRVAMTEAQRPRGKYVIGPDGSPLTIADLPPPNTRRWVIRRKAEVVAAVRGGLLSLEEACSRYTLTVEEFLAWQYSIDRHGLAGLRTTRIQQYRQQPAPTGSAARGRRPDTNRKYSLLRAEPQRRGRVCSTSDRCPPPCPPQSVRQRLD